MVAPGPEPVSPLLQGQRPGLFESARGATAEEAVEEMPMPEMDALEAEFQNFPELDRSMLLKPGRLVTASQKRVEIRKARSKAEADPAVQEARAAAEASETYEGWRAYMTQYYQLLAKRMRAVAPKLRPEIDRMEINSIQSVIALPGNDQGTLDSRQTPQAAPEE